ncbi:phage tail tip lysozyme [Rhizobium sp. NPDC092014]
MAGSTTIREFLVSLGYTVDGNSERKFKESMRGAALQAQLLADAIEGMVKTVAEGVQKVARSFDSLYWASQRTGASVQNIRALSYAVSQLGGSYDGTRSAIEAFGQHLRSNPGYSSMLRSLGIATTENGKMRDQVDILRDLGKVLSTKSYPIALQYGGALGLDENTLRALMSGDLGRRMDEYVKIQKAAGLDSEEAAKRSKDFMQALTQLQATIEAVVTKVLTDLEPALTEKLNALSKWFVDHKDEIKNFIVAVSDAIEGLIEDLGKLIEAFKPVFKTFDDMAKALTGKDGLQAAFEAFAVFLATSWLVRVLGVFSGVKVGWLALAALVGFAPNSMEQARTNGDAINDAIGGTGVGSWFVGARNKVRGWFGMAPLDARGNAINAGDRGKPLSSSQRDRNALETYNMVIAAGGTREMALGIIANEAQESGFNPSATGDGGAGVSSFQWHPDRQRAILKGTGIDVTNPTISHTDAIRAMLWEAQHGDDAKARQAWEAMKNAGSPREAAAIFSNLFERPLARQTEAANRGASAEVWATRIPDKSKSAPVTIPEIFNGGSADRPTKDDDLRLLMKNGAANAALTAGPLTTAGNTSNVTLQQNTTISVMGSSDPTSTANAVANRQNSVNSLMLRNTQGAVR